MPDQHRRDVIVIGASAGGITALRLLLGQLPSPFPAAIFTVMHVAPDAPGLLADILARGAALPARLARNGDTVRPGTVYVAPPDHHLLLEAGGMRISRGPRENRHRPSVDVLFRSAAVAFGPRVIGVVLSGMLDDGSAGLWAIKRRGGVALVQDPLEAEYPDMPRNAMRTTKVDAVLGVAALAARLIELAGKPVAAEAPAPPAMQSEVRMASSERTDMEEMDRLGRRAPLTCPECGGSLWEIEDTGPPRFRCHVGHAYSMQTLAGDQAARVEAALWAALRALEEDRRVADQLAGSAAARGDRQRAEYHGDRSLASERQAQVLRELLEQAAHPVDEKAAQ